MKRFKQKNFVAPLFASMAGKATTGIFVGSSILGVKQGKEANEQNEEAARKAQKEQERHNREMELAAKQNFPNAANAEEGQKVFGFVGNAVNAAKGIKSAAGATQVGRLGKDLWKIHGNQAKDLMAMGGTMAGGMYLGNRVVTSMKNNDNGQSEKNTEAYKKLALTGAGIGAAFLGARHGAFGSTIKGYTRNKLPGQMKSVLNRGVVSRGENGKVSVKGTLGKNAMNLAFGAVPVGMYAIQRKQQKDAMRNAEQDPSSGAEPRSYSEENENKHSGLKKALIGTGLAVGTIAAGRRGLLGGRIQRGIGASTAYTGSVMKNHLGLNKMGDRLVKSGSKTLAVGKSKAAEAAEKVATESSKKKFINDTTAQLEQKYGNKQQIGRDLSSGVNRFATFFGFIGKGGTSAVQKTGETLAKSNNKMSKNLGNWMTKKDANGNLVNAGKANLLAGAGALAAGGTAWGLGEKLVSSPMKVIDKDSSKNEEEQNQTVYSESEVIMKKFKQKSYSRDWTKYAALGTSGAALGVSTVNMLTNRSRNKRSAIYEGKQLEAMDKLTDSLRKMDQDLSEYNTNFKLSRQKEAEDVKKAAQSNKKRKSLFNLFKFKQKNNSHTGKYALRGAGYGLGVGSLVSGLLPDKLGFIKQDKMVDTIEGGKTKRSHNTVYEYDPTSRFNKEGTKYNKIANYYNSKMSNDPQIKRILVSLGATALGAGIGAIIGAIADYTDHKNKAGNERLMKSVVDNLKRMGFKDGIQYTLDPKMATLLKTRVTLVISKTADSMRLIINSANDSKLGKVSEGIIKNLPSMSTTNSKFSDRFNEISITTLSSQENATFVSSVAERFIKEGFPVYLVEVG